jgi:hypothetical protein
MLMKTKLSFVVIASVALIAKGQGFIYDQQSQTSQSGGAGFPIQEDQPMGQSFTPSLPAVGFVQLEFADFLPPNGIGATVYVNLLADSITGPVIGSAAPVSMPDGAFNLVETFLFSTPATVTPGTTYYFQPVVVQPGSNDPWLVIGAQVYNYSGGSYYANGIADTSEDLWFREGVIAAPEPSAISLLFLGSGVLIYARRKFIH